MTMGMDPSATFAVIVGIERYDAGWALDGAASDAIGVAAWLRAAGVPANQVQLMIDTLPDNAETVGQRATELGLTQRKANRDDVIDVFTRELTAVQGQNLIVFWSGHGLLDEQRRRALFTADAHAHDKRTIRVGNLLKFLRGRTIRGFHDQVVIIDACANFSEKMHDRRDITYATLPTPGSNDAVRQFVLYAAAQGQIAQHDQVAKGGAFTAAVLSVLAPPEGPQWPPDMPALSAAVAEHFEQLRSEGDIRQTPVYLSRNVNWLGSEDRKDLGGIPVSGVAQRAAIRLGVTPSQVNQLIRMFTHSSLEVAHHEVMQALRDQTVGDLFERLASSTDGSVAEAELQQIWRVWQIWHRIAEPSRQFRNVTQQQLRVYYDIVPDRQVAPSLTALDDVLEYLAEFGDRGVSSPLLRFVARLEALVGEQLSAEWFGLSANELRGLREKARQAMTAAKGHRLVVHFPDAQWSSEVAGYLRAPDGQWTKHVVASTADEQGARHAVNTLITWAYDVMAGQPVLELGFLVPRVRFDDVPEHWTYVDELSSGRALSEEYPVVLHSGDRIRVPRARRWWQDRLQRIKKDLESEEPQILWLDAPLEPKEITRAVRESPAACVVFGSVPGPLRGALPADPLIAAINPGAPYIIWLDEPPDDWTAVRALITSLVCNGRFDEIPTRVLKIRQDNVETLPYPGIRMLWDNQTSLPEFGQLGGIEVRTI